MTKTTPQQEREGILADFAEEYAGLPLEQWAVGFVATVMNVDANLPKFGEGSDRSFMTTLLVEKFKEALAQREAEIAEECEKNLEKSAWAKAFKSMVVAETQAEIREAVEGLPAYHPVDRGHASEVAEDAKEGLLTYLNRRQVLSLLTPSE